MHLGSHNPTDDSFAALAAQPTALPNLQRIELNQNKSNIIQQPAL
jgi:hypothetical protein